MQQVGVGLRQFLFGGHADNLPVGIVHIIDNTGIAHIVLIHRELLCKSCHPDGCRYLAADEDRLLRNDYRPHHLFDVEGKKVVDLGADGIDRSRDVSSLQGRDKLLKLGARLKGRRNGRIGENLLQTSLQGILHLRPCPRQGIRCVLADKTQIPVIVHVCALGADLRETIGQGNLAVITGHFHFGPGLGEGLIPVDGHFAAVIERQDLLRLDNICRKQQDQDRNCQFSCHIFHLLFRGRNPSKGLPKFILKLNNKGI